MRGILRNVLWWSENAEKYPLNVYSLFFSAAVVDDPEFTDIIENITVPAGRNVKLACSVKNLGSYKVRNHVRSQQLSDT